MAGLQTKSRALTRPSQYAAKMPPISEIFKWLSPLISILESAVMAICRLLQNHAFEPEATLTMTPTTRYCTHYAFAHRSDPITWIVAEKVIQFAQRGERNPVRLRELALESLNSA